MLQVKDIYVAGRKITIQKGDLVRFWKDPWDGEKPLCLSYPGLFDICQDKDCTVEYFVEHEKTLNFRRRLHANSLEQWDGIVRRFELLHLSNQSDVV